MPSFDIVSEIPVASLQNALQNSLREIKTRWDFKGILATIDWAKTEKKIYVVSDSELHLSLLLDIFQQQLGKQAIPFHTMELTDRVERSGKSLKKTMHLKEGIPSSLGKQLAERIKILFAGKVQAKIQGEQLRVTAKQKDDLQKVIVELKMTDWERPLQFHNFKD